MPLPAWSPGIAAEQIVPDFEKVLKTEKDEFPLRRA